MCILNRRLYFVWQLIMGMSYEGLKGILIDEGKVKEVLRFAYEIEEELKGGKYDDSNG